MISGANLFFTATTLANGTELWKSQGNTADTLLVKDINAIGPAASSPTSLIDNAGVLLFVANDGLGGTELWKSDGSSAGTTLVRDLWVGDWTGTISLQKIAGATKVLVTSSNAVTGFEMWQTDGTSAGTTLFFNFAAGAQSPLFSGAVLVGSRLFLTADEGINGSEPWTFLLSALQ